MDSSAEIDEALRQARGGDPEGFAALYRTHQPALLRYLQVLVGAEAEDAASETWLQVTRDLRRFRGGADDLRGWVLTIGRHRAFDLLRARGRRPCDPWDPATLPDSSTVDASVLSEESVATKRALALIAGLPQDQAEAVLLRVVCGLDAPAAAAVLGKRAGAVRMATSRGLARLAALLEDTGVTLPDRTAL
jgi:RNA polymerase sigma-70 factor (ECF subfamily)